MNSSSTTRIYFGMDTSSKFIPERMRQHGAFGNTGIMFTFYNLRKPDNTDNEFLRAVLDGVLYEGVKRKKEK